MEFTVIIPARYASTRLPGKPLLDIAGKPMLQHVYERAIESGAKRVVVATDDDRIAESAASFGGEVVTTAATHASGTDRLAEAAHKLALDFDEIVVNLQGDEPTMPPELLRQVAIGLDANEGADMATLCTRVTSVDQLFNPNVVKVVFDKEGYALFFSRATIPWARDAFAMDRDDLPSDTVHYRHLGIYAYRAGFLSHYTALETSPLEQSEALEQLRVLWHGGRIHVSEAICTPGHGVDTADDLERIRRMFA